MEFFPETVRMYELLKLRLVSKTFYATLDVANISAWVPFSIAVRHSGRWSKRTLDLVLGTRLKPSPIVKVPVELSVLLGTAAGTLAKSATAGMYLSRADEVGAGPTVLTITFKGRSPDFDKPRFQCDGFGGALQHVRKLVIDPVDANHIDGPFSFTPYPELKSLVVFLYYRDENDVMMCHLDWRTLPATVEALELRRVTELYHNDAPVDERVIDIGKIPAHVTTFTAIDLVVAGVRKTPFNEVNVHMCKTAGLKALATKSLIVRPRIAYALLGPDADECAFVNETACKGGLRKLVLKYVYDVPALLGNLSAFAALTTLVLRHCRVNDAFVSATRVGMQLDVCVMHECVILYNGPLISILPDAVRLEVSGNLTGTYAPSCMSRPFARCKSLTVRGGLHDMPGRSIYTVVAYPYKPTSGTTVTSLRLADMTIDVVSFEPSQLQRLTLSNVKGLDYPVVPRHNRQYRKPDLHALRSLTLVASDASDDAYLHMWLLKNSNLPAARAFQCSLCDTIARVLLDHVYSLPRGSQRHTLVEYGVLCTPSSWVPYFQFFRDVLENLIVRASAYEVTEQYQECMMLRFGPVEYAIRHYDRFLATHVTGQLETVPIVMVTVGLTLARLANEVGVPARCGLSH